MFLIRTGYRKPLLVGMTGTALLVILLGQGLHEPSFGGVVIGNFWWVMTVVTILGFFFGIRTPR